jgi:hypothetical protein
MDEYTVTMEVCYSYPVHVGECASIEEAIAKVKQQFNPDEWVELGHGEEDCVRAIFVHRNGEQLFCWRYDEKN